MVPRTVTTSQHLLTEARWSLFERPSVAFLARRFPNFERVLIRHGASRSQPCDAVTRFFNVLLRRLWRRFYQHMGRVPADDRVFSFGLRLVSFSMR